MDRTIYKLLVIGALSLFCVSALAVTVPNKFTANTPAVAADVNENFSVLEAAINSVGGALAIEKRKVIDSSGIATAACLANETVVSAGCRCTGSQSKGTNFGVVFSCGVAGNAALGACYNYSYNASLDHSPIEVTATCVSNAASRQAEEKSYTDKPTDFEAERAVEELREQAAAMNNLLSSGE